MFRLSNSSFILVAVGFSFFLHYVTSLVLCSFNDSLVLILQKYLKVKVFLTYFNNL